MAKATKSRMPDKGGRTSGGAKPRKPAKSAKSMTAKPVKATAAKAVPAKAKPAKAVPAKPIAAKGHTKTVAKVVAKPPVKVTAKPAQTLVKSAVASPIASPAAKKPAPVKAPPMGMKASVSPTVATANEAQPIRVTAASPVLGRPEGHAPRSAPVIEPHPRETEAPPALPVPIASFTF